MYGFTWINKKLEKKHHKLNPSNKNIKPPSKQSDLCLSTEPSNSIRQPFINVSKLKLYDPSHLEKKKIYHLDYELLSGNNNTCSYGVTSIVNVVSVTEEWVQLRVATVHLALPRVYICTFLGWNRGSSLELLCHIVVTHCKQLMN